MRIIDFQPNDESLIRRAARLLVDGFQAHWPEAWPDVNAALREVREALDPRRIARVAMGDDGALLGWIGGIEQYDGRVWELHPLVVRPDVQRRGIGRALVLDLEERVRERGGLTITLGTDDEDGMTTLSGVDLYPNPWEHVAHIRNVKGHPYGFYQRLGFVITGVLPDANGPGKPDILMSKRVAR